MHFLVALVATCAGLSAVAPLDVDPASITAMTREEREQLRDEAKDMFYHAYRAYMDNAYPADELMPLSCRGRWRGTEPNRGDIDDALGNFSLTLVDALDTLVILGDLEEFELALQVVIRDVSFDNDIVVSVFETNIRMLGGLLSAHILAEYLQAKAGIVPWYKGELLAMAKDLGYRLLPAFNTTTGIPHPRINLQYGLKSPSLANSRETCTACAGTMLLEFAALSRLSGEPIFEDKAHRAMDSLWQMRHRSSDLMGTVLNVHNGDWVRRDSGVGAGIDSYYEYCLKAYVLLGDEKYLDRFNRHYSAVMKYVSQGPLLLDVHMHRPHTNSKNFMDALLAFWPGLQVLKGDIKPAIETHEMLYQVLQRHNFLPEAFTTDFQVHWGQHPLRPEFVESTYLLYRATGDPYYLEAGKKVLQSLQKYARVPCGYAAVKDVRTGGHEDRMDSFVLAETLKYLYLLFSDPEDIVLDMDDFVLTTEAHLLPLSLARLSNLTAVPIPDGKSEDYYNSMDEDVEFSRSCPNTHYLFPGDFHYPESIRKPLKNLVEGTCPTRRSLRRKLRAAEFQAGNSEHMKLVRDMGITIVALPDNRVQLLHTFANAKTPEDAEEGLMFMQEMIELSKSQASQPENPPRVVYFKSSTGDLVVINAGPAQFGGDLSDDRILTGPLMLGQPYRMCEDPAQRESLRGKIVVMERGDCMFIDKARRIQRAGAIGGIVVDNKPDTSASASAMFAMSGDGTNDVDIPMLFVFSADARQFLDAYKENAGLEVTLAERGPQGRGEVTEEEIGEDEGEGEDEDDEAVRKLKAQVQEYLHSEAMHKKKPSEMVSEGSAEAIVIRMGEDGELQAETIRTIQREDGSRTVVRQVEKLPESASGKLTPPPPEDSKVVLSVGSVTAVPDPDEESCAPKEEMTRRTRQKVGPAVHGVDVDAPVTTENASNYDRLLKDVEALLEEHSPGSVKYLVRLRALLRVLATGMKQSDNDLRRLYELLAKSVGSGDDSDSVRRVAEAVVKHMVAQQSPVIQPLLKDLVLEEEKDDIGPGAGPGQRLDLRMLSATIREVERRQAPNMREAENKPLDLRESRGSGGREFLRAVASALGELAQGKDQGRDNKDEL